MSAAALLMLGVSVVLVCGFIILLFWDGYRLVTVSVLALLFLAAGTSPQSGLQWLYRNPQWPLGALVLVVLVRPRRAIVWGGRFWWAWKTFKQTQKCLAKQPLQGRSP